MVKLAMCFCFKLIVLWTCAALPAGTNLPALLFVSPGGDDILSVARASKYPNVKQFAFLSEALSNANPGDGLLVMADKMRASTRIPQNDTTVNVTDEQWAFIRKHALRMYIEFPSALPVSGSSGKFAVQQTLWERVVARQDMGPFLPNMSLLHPHKHVDFVRLPTEWLQQSDLVIAKVAGYNSASFGLPAEHKMYPLLVKPEDRLLVAATQLSHCRTRRFSPSQRWMAVVSRILAFASGDEWKADYPLWKSTITASFASDEPLPPNAELMALSRGVQFFSNSMLMPGAKQAMQMTSLNCTSDATEISDSCAAFARRAAPWEQKVSGQGELGIFEGFTSDISIDGSQPQSLGIRGDCTQEVSASFAVRAVLSKNIRDRIVATNLLNYAHVHSGFSQPWVIGGGAGLKSQRPWYVSGDALGIIAWETSDGGFNDFFTDDDARGLLGAIATAGLLQTPRWHSTIVTATLGNLRVTTRSGFGASLSGSSNFKDLIGGIGPNEGWRAIYHSEGTPIFSPHYECYIWAVYLWAYKKSGFAPLLERGQAALTTMMNNYPSKWIPTMNGIAMQRARMILPLAFLVRVNDTKQHREWLTLAVDGFLARKHCEHTWCAFKEEVNCTGWGGSTRVPNNDDYGTFEAPLNQANDDPVSDFLYTSNFALLGLHEAAAVTGNATIKDAEDRLVDLIVRVQAKSTVHPNLDGAFFRAFDFQKWEAWASDADAGWGAWSIESGWTQSWITIMLGLRLLNTSLWDLGESIEGIETDFATWIPTMFWEPSATKESNSSFTARSTSFMI